MNLQIAIPSKGRLRKNALAIFAKAGLKISASEKTRNYKASIATIKNIDVNFLSASEIAKEIAQGSIHLGITGLDLAAENGIKNSKQNIAQNIPLGFGSADVVVAVPQAWLDVESMSDIDDIAANFRTKYGRRLRVATKYRSLTQGYFQKCGIGIYRLVDSVGATEAAPTSGQADIIVDITSSGETLKANNLKTLIDGTILKSQAYLLQSQKAKFTLAQKKLANKIISKIKKNLAL